MAERNNLNVGEPADESAKSVDGDNSRPRANVSEGGDQEQFTSRIKCLGINSGDYNAQLSQELADLGASSEFHNFYDDDNDANDDKKQRSGGRVAPSASTENEWDGKSDLCFRIIPLIGAVSYEYFSLKITNPSWFIRAFYGNDQLVSNVLWLQSHVGIGLFIYSHKHIRALILSRRLLFSAIGSLMFNYSSCLFWAIGKRYLPPFESTRVAFGLLTGWFLLSTGREYLHQVDKMCNDQID